MSNVSDLEQQLKNAKVLVAQRALALKLSKNPDFRKLILEEFMVNEAARYVAVSCDPSLNAVQRADALALAQAGGHLKRWLSVQMQMGYTAENDIPRINEAIDDARAQGESDSQSEGDE